MVVLGKTRAENKENTRSHFEQVSYLNFFRTLIVSTHEFERRIQNARLGQVETQTIKITNILKRRSLFLLLSKVHLSLFRISYYL